MTTLGLSAAVEGMADVLMGINCGSTFSGMTCTEAESVAAVFVVAGRLDAAAHVLMLHGDGDDEQDDRHHDIYEALRGPRGGFSHNLNNESFRLATEYARDLN